MAADFQKERAFPGIESSPAFAAPQKATVELVLRPAKPDRGAERFIRTSKENLLWVRTFATVERLRPALLAFREVYNATWPIERHGFRLPAAIRDQQLQPAALAA